MSQFGSFGNCVWTLCLHPSPIPLLLATPLVIHEKSWQSIEVVETFLSTILSLKSCSHSGTSCSSPLRNSSSSSFLVALFHPDTNTRSKLVNSRNHLHYPSQKQWLPGIHGKQEPPRRARLGAPTCSHEITNQQIGSQLLQTDASPD